MLKEKVNWELIHKRFLLRCLGCTNT